MPEFEFPAIHISREFEEDGELYSEPVTPPVCDFCFDRRVTWEYPCERFVIAEPIEFGSDGEFAACDACSALVEAKNDGGLVDRIVRSWYAMDRAGVSMNLHKFGRKRMVISALLIVRAFNAHRTGPRKAFG